MSLRHAFESTIADGADATKLRPSNWGSTETNYDTTPTHVFTGGAQGAVLYRNTGDVEGASWLAAAAGVLTCSGVGQAPAWTASVSAALGGTGITSYTAGDLLYASGASALSKLAAVASGQVLASNGVGAAPVYTASPSLTGLTLAGTLAFTATTGASVGVINKNGARFLHTFKPPLGTATEDNIFIGRNAGNFTMSTVGGSDPAHDGQFNVGIGDGSLEDLTYGSWNIGIGNAAARSITSGSGNTAIGGDSMLNVTTGTDNSSYGIDALRDCAGHRIGNTALGARAMKTNTAGDNNTVVGYDAFAEGTGTGSNNVVIGALAMNIATTGSGNVAIGINAMIFATTGSNNTVVGNAAGDSITTGNSNILVGPQAGNSVTTGSNNMLIGTQAGGNITTGSNNIFIGDLLNAASGTADYQMNIGGVLIGQTSLGALPGLTGTFVAGSAAAPSVKIGDAGWYQESSGKVSFSASSARQMSIEAGFVTLWSQSGHLRFGTGPDVVIRRSGTNTLTIDDGGAGPGILSVTTRIASAVFRTTTALVTATNGGSTAAFTANMVGATNGPTTAAQHGWQLFQDPAGATVWVPVWK